MIKCNAVQWCRTPKGNFLIISLTYLTCKNIGEAEYSEETFAEGEHEYSKLFRMYLCMNFHDAF